MKNYIPRNDLCGWGIGQWEFRGYKKKYRKNEVRRDSKMLWITYENENNLPCLTQNYTMILKMEWTCNVFSKLIPFKSKMGKSRPLHQDNRNLLSKLGHVIILNTEDLN